MYSVIRVYDEQAFNNMSEESEKKNSIEKKLLWPVPSQGMVEQAKKHDGYHSQNNRRKNRKKTYTIPFFPRSRHIKKYI